MLANCRSFLLNRPRRLLKVGGAQYVPPGRRGRRGHRLRLHQRLSRHRERRGAQHRHRSPQAPSRRASEQRPQRRRSPHLAEVAATVASGIVSQATSSFPSSSRASWGHRVERDHVVFRDSLQLQPRAHRRRRRSDDGPRGAGSVLWSGIVERCSPFDRRSIFALVIAALATSMSRRLTRKSDDTTKSWGMKAGQIGSSSLLSIAHGTNDAQKTMGVITLALIANGTLGANGSTPMWVVLTCASPSGSAHTSAAGASSERWVRASRD